MTKTICTFTAILLLLALQLPAQQLPGLQMALHLTTDQYNTLVAGAEQTDPASADSLPGMGNFWSAQNPYQPALPGNVNGLPAWSLGNGCYLLDDLDFDYSMSRFGMSMDLDFPSPGGGGGGGGGYISNGNFFNFDTNLLWLEITNVADGTVYANLHNATDEVYAIWSTTNLLTPWQVETEVWPMDTNCWPFTVPTLDRQDLFLRAEDWTGVESNGLFVWWTWLYFGNLSESATDYDSQGAHTLGYDYANGHDPNVILFSELFTNYYVNTRTVVGQLQISAGLPSYIAVLVNDTNQADAVWEPYTSTNFVATLGPTNGTYFVYVGLKGLPTIATQTWNFAGVSLYTDALQLTLTTPTSSTVYQSSLQLQGYASQPLKSLTLDVSNSIGIFPAQPGFLPGLFYDTNLLAYTTNSFESISMYLTSGTNLITLHAKDWAGNTTNMTLALNYIPNTNAPVLNLAWPQPGMPVSGSNFTVQAQVSDSTATVTATVNGNTTTGLVEVNGTVWMQNLALNPGTNMVTLTASNVFGGVTTTNFNVVENDIGLKVNPLPAGELNQTAVNVTGAIANPTDNIVYVNGSPASYIDGNGDWEAYGVTVNPTGTAILNVQVTNNGTTLIADQTVNQPQPPVAVLLGYTGISSRYDIGAFAGGNFPELTVDTLNWAYGSGGISTESGYHPNDSGTAESFDDSSSSLPAGNTNYMNIGVSFVCDYFSTGTIGDGAGGLFQRSSQAQMAVIPPGQQASGIAQTYLVFVNAAQFSNPVQANLGTVAGDVPVTAPETVQLNGQPLVGIGLTNTDGSVTGVAPVSEVAGQPPTFSLTSPANAATFGTPQARNFRLTVVSNSAVQINGTTNWATIKSSSTNDYVIIQAMVDGASAAILTNFGAKLQWTGGLPSTNPLQRLVSKTVSSNTIVTASLGGSLLAGVNVWVIWATWTEFNTTGPEDSDCNIPSANLLWTGMNVWGAGAHSSNLFFNGTLMQCTISPVAFFQFSNVVSYNFTQTKESQQWENDSGTWTQASPHQGPGSPDGPEPTAVDLIPSPAGHMYVSDAPGFTLPNSLGPTGLQDYVYSGSFIEDAYVTLPSSSETKFSADYPWHSISWATWNGSGYVRNTGTNANEVLLGAITVGTGSAPP